MSREEDQHMQLVQLNYFLLKAATNALFEFKNVHALNKDKYPRMAALDTLCAHIRDSESSIEDVLDALAGETKE